MKRIALSLKEEVLNFIDRYEHLTEEVTSVRLDESRWTLKEIIGHLIDSASNNHQRMTRLQLVEELSFPSYENEKWLAAEKWNVLGWHDILYLFKYYNLFISHLIGNVNLNCLKNHWSGQNRSGDRIFSLEELMADYLRHLKEHLAHFETRLKEIHEKR